jgi:hypothetical protein
VERLEDSDLKNGGFLRGTRANSKEKISKDFAAG